MEIDVLEEQNADRGGRHSIFWGKNAKEPGSFISFESV
jgi:hypothetical protein